MRNEKLTQFLNCGAIIAMPNKKVLIGWGEREWRSAPSTDPIPSFYFPDFFLEIPKPWFCHQYFEEFEIDVLIDFLGKFQTENIKKQWIPADFLMFFSAFEDLQKRFQSNELKKAVPFVFEESYALFTQKCKIQSLRNVLAYAKQHHAHIYGFWCASEGILGATPEILFHKEVVQNEGKALIHTLACAGTSQIQKSQELSGEKTEIEHQLVVEGIHEVLKSYGKVTIGKSSILQLSVLSHIITPIDFSPYYPISFKQLVELLHPTPALGAFPKKQGNKWLREFYRNTDRKRFGAPIGYVKGNDEEFYCLVGIRNIQWCDQLIRLGVGCGVIPQSDLWKEWEEIRLKIAATKEMLGV